ncbi:hypothetical protein SUGI_0350420 [Cryptomeria japonica]|nr:hypothetical protein SUGI_0350420 [Cryptomeria japonica]
MWLLVSTNLLSGADYHGRKRKLPKPCMNFVMYFYDIIYNGENAHNATSVFVAALEGDNLTIMIGNNRFGNLVVIDDPITMDNNLYSPPVGRA